MKFYCPVVVLLTTRIVGFRSRRKSFKLLFGLIVKNERPIDRKFSGKRIFTISKMIFTETFIYLRNEVKVIKTQFRGYCWVRQ